LSFVICSFFSCQFFICHFFIWHFIISAVLCFYMMIILLLLLIFIPRASSNDLVRATPMAVGVVFVRVLCVRNTLGMKINNNNNIIII